MTDSHGSPPDDEPKTPMWLPALGAALFVSVALWWAVTPSAAPIAPDDAASACRGGRRTASAGHAASAGGGRGAGGSAGGRRASARVGGRHQAGSQGRGAHAPASRGAGPWGPRQAPLIRVGVVGASGYSGAVAVRLVESHPRLTLAFATSDKVAGENVAAQLGLQAPDDTCFVPNAAALDHADTCDAVLLATAADVSMRLAPAFAERGRTVIDLSGAFRLEAGAYPRWYGFEHTAPVWLERAHYGLPELFPVPRAPPPGATLVANPGCYPTAALLALGPLLREGLVEPTGIVVDAKSGVTGAGRQSGDAYSFVAVDADVRAYRVLAHQHTPEITRALSRFARTAAKLTFTAHLLPVARGLLATCYARPRAGADATRVAQCLHDGYDGSPFVRVVAPEEVRLSRVVGTNLAYVGASADEDMVVAVCAIDNLLKGAAGQAIQNLNALNGWDEALGLEHLQRVSP